MQTTVNLSSHSMLSRTTVVRAWRATEAALLLAILLAHWGPVDGRLGALILYLPLFVGRALVLRRVITRSAFDVPLAAFVALCMLNLALAPFSWGLWVTSRALMGAGVVWVIGDWGRTPGMARLLLAVLVGFGLVLGVAALFTSQYTIKSAVFDGLVAALPRLRDLPLLAGGFNVNEVGGPLALLAPMAAGLLLAERAAIGRGARWLGAAALVALWLPLMLGQSRMAILGALFGTGVVIFAVTQPGWRRRAALVVLAAVSLFEAGITLNVFVPEQVAQAADVRDSGSQLGRLNIWRAAVAVIRDHPLTGIGMNQFRLAEVRALYPVTGYPGNSLPHAHNIMLQTGADLGLPGLAAYLGWSAAFLWGLWRAWRAGGALAVGAGAAFGGWLAFMTFNIADAIGPFDRFIFLYWLLIGLGAAIASAARAENAPPPV